MTFDLSKILASKLSYRHALADRSIVDKLRMLDAMRERAIALRKAPKLVPDSSVVSETSDYVIKSRSSFRDDR